MLTGERDGGYVGLRCVRCEGGPLGQALGDGPRPQRGGERAVQAGTFEEFGGGGTSLGILVEAGRDELGEVWLQLPQRLQIGLLVDDPVQHSVPRLVAERRLTARRVREYGAQREHIGGAAQLLSTPSRPASGIDPMRRGSPASSGSAPLPVSSNTSASPTRNWRSFQESNPDDPGRAMRSEGSRVDAPLAPCAHPAMRHQPPCVPAGSARRARTPHPRAAAGGAPRSAGPLAPDPAGRTARRPGPVSGIIQSGREM